MKKYILLKIVGEPALFELKGKKPDTTCIIKYKMDSDDKETLDYYMNIIELGKCVACASEDDDRWQHIEKPTSGDGYDFYDYNHEFKGNHTTAKVFFPKDATSSDTKDIIKNFEDDDSAALWFKLNFDC